MVRSLILAAGTAALLLPSLASAQAGGGAAPQSIKRTDLAGKLDSAFAASDTNHDGSLSLSEIGAAQNRDLQQAAGQLRAKLQAAFKQLDTNKDGQLSFQEFAASAGTLKATATPAQILQQLDTNHDGKVSAAEYSRSRLAAFDKMDLNHDGVVTADEARRANGQK